MISSHPELLAANYDGAIWSDTSRLPKIMRTDPRKKAFVMKDVIPLLDVLYAYSTSVEGAAVDRELWEEAVGPLRKAYPDCVVLDQSISINPYFDAGFIGLVVYAEFYDPLADLVRARVVATSVYEENPAPELVKTFYRQRVDMSGATPRYREEGRLHEFLIPTLQTQVEAHLGPSVLASLQEQAEDGALGDVAALVRGDAPRLLLDEHDPRSA